MTTPVITPPEEAPLVLQAPEVIQPVAESRVAGAVRLPDLMKEKVENQLNAFMETLLKGDPSSDEFKSKMDQAFSIGRKEISDSTTLSNRFTKMDFRDAADTPAFQAITSMRTLFDELNPAKQGDLFTPTKILGIPVPFGNKLANYLRRYESAETHLGKLQEHLMKAKDELQKDVAELGVARQQIWASLEKLEGASYFMRTLDQRLATSIESIKQREPDRGRALEQEVLYYVRQNLGDVQAAQALAINAYNVISELRKTGRETINGCDRVATLGMAALSVAVTLARATGNQIKTQQMLSGAKTDIQNLIAATGDALNSHVDATNRFSADPLLGVQELQNMFDKTFSAMDKMEKFRSEALSNMQTNNQMLRDQIVKAQDRIKNDRQANTHLQSVEAAKPILEL
ncbi:toxic anion resistance protein [Massilia sp. W12]|uniref:toxic anion resistance protein n=1 Tax=Massilia sp. W12 TaxID=3126507 RepID=UPI0030CB92E9